MKNRWLKTLKCKQQSLKIYENGNEIGPTTHSIHGWRGSSPLYSSIASINLLKSNNIVNYRKTNKWSKLKYKECREKEKGESLKWKMGNGETFDSRGEISWDSYRIEI